MKPAYQRVQEMSNDFLVVVWDALENQYWTEDDYNGDVTMTEWANLVYSEMVRRRIPRKRTTVDATIMHQQHMMNIDGNPWCCFHECNPSECAHLDDDFKE